MAWILLLGLALVLGLLAMYAFTVGEQQTLAQRVEERSARATEGWTTPLVVITYAANKEGEALYRLQAPILARHGYFPLTQSASAGGVSAGHVLAFGVLGLAARKGGTMVVTYRREAA